MPVSRNVTRLLSVLLCLALLAGCGASVSEQVWRPARHSLGKARRLVVVQATGRRSLREDVLSELRRRANATGWWHYAERLEQGYMIDLAGGRPRARPRPPQPGEVFLWIDAYESSAAREPGSGGANDVGSHCWQTIAIMRHDKRRFIEKVDFITTPGYLTGPGAREAAGLPPGTGPYRVVTTLAMMGYHPESKRMMLLATQPDVSVEMVIENTGFDLILPENIERNPPPSQAELRILREEVDKDKLYI